MASSIFVFNGVIYFYFQPNFMFSDEAGGIGWISPSRRESELHVFRRRAPKDIHSRVHKQEQTVRYITVIN